LQGRDAKQKRAVIQKFDDLGFVGDYHDVLDIYLKGALNTGEHLIPMFGIVHTPGWSKECPDPETTALVYVCLCTNPTDPEFRGLKKEYEICRPELEAGMNLRGYDGMLRRQETETAMTDLVDKYETWLRRRSADLSNEMSRAIGMPLRVHIEAHDPEAYPKIVWKGAEPCELVREVESAVPLIFQAGYSLLTVQQYLEYLDRAFTRIVYRSEPDPVMEMARELSMPIRDGGLTIQGINWNLTDDLQI